VNLDELEDLLRRGEKEKAYELIKGRMEGLEQEYEGT